MGTVVLGEKLIQDIFRILAVWPFDKWWMLAWRQCVISHETRNKEILKQMWRGLFCFHGVLSLPFYFICIKVLTFLEMVSIQVMLYGCRKQDHWYPSHTFYFYLHFKNHSICYFREYNYFCKVKNNFKENVSRDMRMNDITKIHYCKFIFKDNVTFKKDKFFFLFFFAVCAMNVLW